jgi:hypothetical protein
MYNASAMKRPGLKRKPSRAVERLRKAAAHANGGAAHPNGAGAHAGASKPPAKVVSLLEPELVLERAARRFLPHAIDRCVKCDSTFVGREPAFIHCYYCGKMARIANASLLVQEEFELRSGLRIAV